MLDFGKIILNKTEEIPLKSSVKRIRRFKSPKWIESDFKILTKSEIWFSMSNSTKSRIIFGKNRFAKIIFPSGKENVYRCSVMWVACGSKQEENLHEYYINFRGSPIPFLDYDYPHRCFDCNAVLCYDIVQNHARCVGISEEKFEKLWKRKEVKFLCCSCIKMSKFKSGF